ncbi:MAG: hypothetical protein RPR97_07250 [Colwellia sp.]|jgi:hypothetical protein
MSHTPNYVTNQNLHVENLLNRLKSGDTPVIEFIDIWGEGFLSEDNIITGFKNSYNINKEAQLVSNPPDMGREIPNLIPVKIWESNFCIIPSGKVNILTLMGAPITETCASEIARMISSDGNIIIYGFNSDDTELIRLEKKLKKIDFIQVSKYELAKEFTDITIKPVIIFTKQSNLNPIISDDP